MPKAIALTQTVFSKIFFQYSERWVKIITVSLLCSLLLLVAVYFLQTGDLIKKTFILGGYQVKMASIEKQESAVAIANVDNLLSLNQIEELAANSGFVPVGQVLYIPLTTGLTASANQLVVSNIR